MTQWYHPEPVTVPVWLAKSLSRCGVNVHVLTGVPNYPEGIVQSGYSARRVKKEWIGELPVLRTPLYASHDSSAVKRILNYLTWAFSATILGGAAFRRADVVLVYSSPATAALPAIWQRRRRGIPYVLLIQDLWPDSIFASGLLRKPLIGRFLEPVVERLVRHSYVRAERIAVISPGMKDVLIERGVPEAKLDVVFNWADEAVLHPLPNNPELRKQLGIGSKSFIAMYAGNLGAAQNLGHLIEAFRRLGEDSCCHLVLVGSGIQSATLKTQAQQLANVHFLPAVSFSEIGQVMAGADAQIISLSDDPLFYVTLPGKVQSILAAGRPAIVAAPGDAAKVITEAGAGISSSPGDPDDLAATIKEMASLTPRELSAMGARGFEYYCAHMSEEVGSRNLIDILRSAAGWEKAAPKSEVAG